ncbi:MAG: sulfurtransferase [Hyphomicrobiales bacterium]|nr:sulfurtransferase [Hyphomicrobiales bacterium]
MQAAQTVDAASLKQWLHDGDEIALLDVREHGEYGEAHLFYGVPLPFSRLETGLGRLVPRRSCRIVMYDDGVSGVAARAADRAVSYGYERVFTLAGGAAAWRHAGFELFAGVHVPSKTFGELVEHAEAVPSIAAADLRKLLAEGGDVVVVDSRPVDEYRKMNIPGSLCCPNGELAYRIGQIVTDPATTVVVNCAGRTRSIIGAATLRRFGVRNPVLALENGTMGWRLAGFDLEHGSSRLYPDAPAAERLDRLKHKAGEIASRHGVSRIEAATVAKWLTDRTARTTYLLDIRTEEEFRADGLPGAVWAPGGQLLQATDQWLGVRNARVVLTDDNEVRAILVASWLTQLGWETHVLAGGVEAGRGRISVPPGMIGGGLLRFPPVSAAELGRRGAQTRFFDVRSSMEYRTGHIKGAFWATRARLEKALEQVEGREVVVIAGDDMVGRAFAADLERAGCRIAGIHLGSPERWREAGLVMEATPQSPPDAECIDYLFFVHDRHDDNLEAARQYIAWETGLADRIDRQERAAFRIPENRHAEAS